MRRFLGLLAIPVLWQILYLTTDSAAIVSTPAVLHRFLSLTLDWRFWAGDVWASLQILILGFSLAAVTGFSMAMLMTYLPGLVVVLMPVIDSVRVVAALTLFPLFIVLFGLGLTSKTIVIFWTAWPAVLLNTFHGLTHVDQDYLDAAALDGANRYEVLTKIQLPLSMPFIFTGLRIGVSGGWISLVAAEMLGSNAGLGYAVLSYSQTFRFAGMYANILYISLLGFVFNYGLLYVQQRLEETPTVSPFVKFQFRAISS